MCRLRLLASQHPPRIFFFFFNDTATTEIYTFSLHDALPISSGRWPRQGREPSPGAPVDLEGDAPPEDGDVEKTSFSNRADELLAPGEGGDDQSEGHPTNRRSEEHTSELQSQSNIVCRLLLEK